LSFQVWLDLSHISNPVNLPAVRQVQLAVLKSPDVLNKKKSAQVNLADLFYLSHKPVALNCGVAVVTFGVLEYLQSCKYNFLSFQDKRFQTTKPSQVNLLSFLCSNPHQSCA